MVKICVCAGCNNSRLSGHKVHRFPEKGSKRFRYWVKFVQVKRADFTASSVQQKHSVICGAHFRDECYMLSPNAVPSIQSPGQSQASASTTGRSTTSSAAAHKSDVVRTIQSHCETPDVSEEPMEENEATVQSSELHTLEPSLQVSSLQTDVEGGCQTDCKKSDETLDTQLNSKNDLQIGTQVSENTLVPRRHQGSQTSIHWKRPPHSLLLKPFRGFTKIRPLDNGDAGDSNTCSPKYIVDEECLLQLFEKCPECCSICKVQKMTTGTFLTIDQHCTQCHFIRKWRSQRCNETVPLDHPRSCTNGPEGSAAGTISEMIVSGDENGSSGKRSIQVDDGELNSDRGMVEHHNIDSKLADIGPDKDAGNAPQADAGAASDSDTGEQENFHQLCPECGKMINLRLGHRSHACQTKYSSNRPYACNMCGKSFKQESRLKFHNRIHEDGYKHLCTYCLSSFRTRYDRRKHERTHLPAAKRYQCPDCTEVFAKKRERNDHLVTHRGPKRPLVKTFTCLVCDMVFSSDRRLQWHVAVHTKAKRFVCEVCPSSFTQSIHLKSHMRVHTGEKPYQCQHCNKSFNHYSTLYTHTKCYHRQVPKPGKTVQMEKTNRSGSEARKDETNKMESSAVDAEEAKQNHSAKRAMRRERVFRDRTNLFEEGDEWLQRQFCLPRHSLVELCIALEPQLSRQTRRSFAIPAHIQVLCCLGFLSTGTFQREIADRCSMSQPSLSRILPEVLNGIIGLAPQYMQFPYTPEQQQEIKRSFFNMAGFPDTIGAIGCMHVRLKSPSSNPFAYLTCLPDYHSVKVQIICDANMNIISADTRWGGASHNSFILQNSSVGKRLAQEADRPGAGCAWLIGDKGYALSTWLMTPLHTPQTQQEQAYNDSHGRTHAVVERTMEVLIGRWLCLDTDKEGGKLLYQPDKVCKIAMACCVLHNIANRHGVPLPAAMPPPVDMPVDPPIEAENNKPALALRQQLISRFGSKNII